MKRIQIFIVFLLSSFYLLSQQKDVKGVSIAEDTLAPHPNALLDIRSYNKGVLFPTVSLEEMYTMSGQFDGQTISPSGNKEVPHGTFVFVVIPLEQPIQFQQLRGLWYYSWNQLDGVYNWHHLRPRAMAYPSGTILPLHLNNENLADLFDPSTGEGIPGSRMEGWKLLNRQDAKEEDLSGKYLVGANAPKKGSIDKTPPYFRPSHGAELTDAEAFYLDPTNVSTGEEGKMGRETYAIKTEQIPKHYHKTMGGEKLQNQLTNNATIDDHRHNLTSNQNHNHSIAIGGNNSGYDKNRIGTKKEGADGWLCDCRTDDRREGNNFRAETAAPVIKPAAATVTDFSTTPDIERTEVIEKLDLVPDSYEVLFIIKL